MIHLIIIIEILMFYPFFQYFSRKSLQIRSWILSFIFDLIQLIFLFHSEKLVNFFIIGSLSILDVEKLAIALVKL